MQLDFKAKKLALNSRCHREQHLSTFHSFSEIRKCSSKSKIGVALAAHSSCLRENVQSSNKKECHDSLLLSPFSFIEQLQGKADKCFSIHTWKGKRNKLDSFI
ncbi:hypothetical protein V8G54_021374 [Vigna mungo]|uniref:Uncharacterized protein n=1 Tax=Vigna mungo TaxID=3915 RepID=A0AAQ3RWT9_VIGMU